MSPMVLSVERRTGKRDKGIHFLFFYASACEIFFKVMTFMIRYFKKLTNEGNRRNRDDFSRGSQEGFTKVLGPE